MLIPVQIGVSAGGAQTGAYRRLIDTGAKFDALGERASDMREPFGSIAQDLHVQLEATFATQGAIGASGKWSALSPAYSAWKQRHAPGTPILVGLRRTGAKGQRPQTYAVSGRMRRQLLAPLTDRLAWHISPRRMAYTPLSNIAGWHETGTSRMPARPPVDLTLQFYHSVDRTFVTWLNGLLSQSGL